LSGDDPIPTGKSDAVTHGSIIDGSRGRDQQWRWYYACIRSMLLEIGCPAADLDDLCHDFLLTKLDRVFRGYRPQAGRFRPYLQRCVRNAFIDQLRVRSNHWAAPLADNQPEAPPLERANEEEAEVLNQFFDVLFSRYFSEQTKSELGFFLLRDWCVSGRSLEQSIAEHRLSIGVEHARKLRSQAVQSFASFVFERMDADDFAVMAEEAEQHGHAFGVQHAQESIVALFRWPSEEKRLTQVALLLKHLFHKYRARGLDFDAL
jgi:hypothetical protein